MRTDEMIKEMYMMYKEIRDVVYDIQKKVQNFEYKERDKRFVEKCAIATQKVLDDVQNINKKAKKNQDFDTKDVYLMQNKDGFTKIGIATDVKNRERTLQAENPTTRVMYVCYGGGLALEKSLHKLFLEKGKHIRGEWFNLDNDDYAFLLENFSFTKMEGAHNEN